MSGQRGSPLFDEYFHGDTGEGLGAGHKTRSTTLIGGAIERLLRLATFWLAAHDACEKIAGTQEPVLDRSRLQTG